MIAFKECSPSFDSLDKKNIKPMNLFPYELCVLVVDVSSSMDEPERIGSINKVFQKFKNFINKNK